MEENGVRVMMLCREAEWEEVCKMKSSSTCLGGCPSRDDSIYRERTEETLPNHKPAAQESHDKEPSLTMV